jgi:RNA polymerase sigma factor (sigma-70 family)
VPDAGVTISGLACCYHRRRSVVARRFERRHLLAARASSHAKTAELEAWVLATAAEAVAYASTLLRNREAAEDIVQDCYCRLLGHADVYDLPRDGRKLLFRSITNACRNVRRRARPATRLDATDDGEDRGPRLELVDDSAFPPVEIAIGAELERAIGEGLARLKLSQRAALELRSLGYSLEEVAEMLGVSANNARVLVHRGRVALAEYLTPFLDVQEPAMRRQPTEEPRR